jgi:hypothetical protein
MEFQVKLFSWQDVGNHLIILARGPMDGWAFTRLFDQIRTETQKLSECKVLVDLVDVTCKIEVSEMETFVAGLPLDDWPKSNKIAFTAPPEISNYQRLYMLRTALAARGMVVGVFRDCKVALDWLAGLI